MNDIKKCKTSRQQKMRATIFKCTIGYQQNQKVKNKYNVFKTS